MTCGKPSVPRSENPNPDESPRFRMTTSSSAMFQAHWSPHCHLTHLHETRTPCTTIIRRSPCFPSLSPPPLPDTVCVSLVNVLCALPWDTRTHTPHTYTHTERERERDRHGTNQGSPSRTLFALHRAIQLPSISVLPPVFLLRSLITSYRRCRRTSWYYHYPSTTDCRQQHQTRYVDTPLLRLFVIPPRKRAHFVPVPARTAAASRQPTSYPCGRRRHLHPARHIPRDWMAPPTRHRDDSRLTFHISP